MDLIIENCEFHWIGEHVGIDSPNTQWNLKHVCYIPIKFRDSLTNSSGIAILIV